MSRSDRRMRFFAVVALLTPMLGVLGWTAPTASAATRCTTSWNGGVGSWEDASRWSGGAVPGRDDVACIEAGSSQAAPKVTVSRNEVVDRVVTSGATLRLLGGTELGVGSFGLAGSTVSGPGGIEARETLTAQHPGAPSTLSTMTIDGAATIGIGDRPLTVSRTIGLAGGSTLDLTSSLDTKIAVSFANAAKIADLDGDVDNRVVMTGVFVANAPARIDVPVKAESLFTLRSGQLTIPRLNWLRSGGTLASTHTSTPTGLTYLFVGQPGSQRVATLVLGRDVFGVGRDFYVQTYGESGVRAPDGADAFTGLRRVAGDLTEMYPQHELAVSGRLRIEQGGEVSVSDMRAPSVDVSGYLSVGHLQTSRVTGPASGTVSAGYEGSTTSQAGVVEFAGFLSLTDTSMASLDLSETSDYYAQGAPHVIVRGPAHLAGAASLDEGLTTTVHDGQRVTVLAVHGAIDGQFSSVTSNQPGYSATLSYEPHRVVATFHADS